MPTRRQRAGFSLAIPDNTNSQQVRVIKNRTIRVRQ
jgi:hypothetical protein